MNDCQCEGCKNGLEAMHARHDELMKKFGWMVHYITPDENYPFGVNIHTHGFPEKFKHPDVQICLPLSPENAQGIMNNIGRLLEGGKKFKAKRKYNDIIERFPVLMLPATEDDRKVLRVVFPDKHGRFDTEFSKSQMKDI
ncbi:MAG: DUF4262 domain-containing protein [Bacteroidia bacterium]